MKKLFLLTLALLAAATAGAQIHLEGDVLDGVDVAVIDVDVINFQ